VQAANQVTSFLPLGVQASDFRVAEETSHAFDQALTEQIEAQLEEKMRSDASYRDLVRASLLVRTVVTCHD
jgi:hypothetical protein